MRNDIIGASKVSICAAILALLLVGCGGGGSGMKALPEDSALLSWSAPLTRVNGESIAMGELDRYVIRYGQSTNNLSRFVIVDGASESAEMSYVIYNLDAGTW